MYKRSATTKEPDADEDLVRSCKDAIHRKMKDEITISDRDLTKLIREYNYVTASIIQHLQKLNAQTARITNGDEDYEDEMFDMDQEKPTPAPKSAGQSTAPPPGFKGPPPGFSQHSAMALHLEKHPPNRTPVAEGGIDEIAEYSDLPEDVVPFDFNEPSPDDLVLGSQKAAFKKGGDESTQTAKTGSVQVGKGRVLNFGGGANGAPAKKAGPSGTGTPKSATASPAASVSPNKRSGLTTSVELTPPSLDGSPMRTSGDAVKKKQIVKQMPDAKRGKLLAEIKQAHASGKPHMNMVVIGHVDAGKSTTMGHILALTGRVSKQVIDKYEHESRQRGKATFHFAWVMDQHDEERERGVTIDVSVQFFETNKYKITLLDAPGHKDFVPNMISGAAQADVAILVVTAAQSEFEKGFGEHGQTREHALLARSLGVSQIIVAVNKMDSVNWDQGRFNSVKENVLPFLKKTGFKESNIAFVPVSGLSGENLTTSKAELLKAWYPGPTLLDQIDKFAPPEREIDKPFRIAIGDVYKEGGAAIGGKVETGFFSTGDKLMLMPSGDIATVKAIKKQNGDSVEWASAGDNVDVTLLGIEPHVISVGAVLCDPEQPIPVCRKFRAQIITFSLDVPIMKGHRVSFFSQNVNVPARVTSLIGLVDKATGEVGKKRPRAIGEKVTAVVDVAADQPICIELYSNIRNFGRFMLREEGKTIAAGIITELDPQASTPASSPASPATPTPK